MTLHPVYIARLSSNTELFVTLRLRLDRKRFFLIIFCLVGVTSSAIIVMCNGSGNWGSIRNFIQYITPLVALRY
jgi:hypothetical protein